jgi:hypothetical protein
LLATAFLAAGLLLGTTGCAFFTTVATDIPYNASDGVAATVGNIDVRNAFGVSANGETVNLVMVVINTGTTAETVNFQYNFSPKDSSQKITKTVTVPPGKSISFGNGHGAPELILTDANTKLGALLPIFIQYGDQTGKELLVPILDNSLPGYGRLLPTLTPTATPTPTTGVPVAPAVGTGTATATPTPTPTP